MVNSHRLTVELLEKENSDKRSAEESLRFEDMKKNYQRDIDKLKEQGDKSRK